VGIEKQFGPRAPEIILRAFDKLYKLQRKRHSKAWEQMSVADIVRQIASDAGLRAECDIDMRGTFHQLNLSDFNFLHALSARFATTVRLEGDTLVMKREDAAGDPILLKIDGNLRRLSVRFSTVRQPGKAKVSGYDLKAGEAFTKIRDRLSGVFDGETAADFVTDEELFPRPHPRSAGEAEAYARGAFDAVALNFLTGEAVINGDPDCRPGRVVSVEGADARFNGEYKIVSATHRFDSTHGYETFLMIARGWIRRQ
jgi:phage protein D